MLKTVNEVVDHLLSELPIDKLEEVRKVMDRDYGPNQDSIETIHIRITFGRYIRNKYGLWENNEELARDCLRVDPDAATATYRMWANDGVDMSGDTGLILGEVHPDDASSIINIRLLRKIRELHSRK